MHKENIDILKKFMPDLEKDIYPVLGCSMEKLIKENNNRRVIPQHILRQIAAYPSIRGEYVLIDKITKWILARVEIFASTKSFPLLGEKAISSIEPYIYKTLYTICFRTYTNDYNKTRTTSPDIRPEEYEQLFNDPQEVEAFFRRYPALADIVINHKNKIVALITEILVAYHRDIKVIKETMQLRHNTITQITMGMGDSHHGKTVTLLHLKDEKLLYKPSAGHVNTLYARFAEKFSATSGIEIYTPKVVLRDNWHWCEYIQHQPCNNPQELASFYESLGAQLMLVYALNGHDVHYENLIAMGKHPVIVDYECLFSATRQETDDDLLSDSVLSTGMLPSMRPNHDGRYTAAISAIDNEKCAYRYVIEKNESGLTEVKRQQAAFKTLDNIPVLNGERVTAALYGEQILSGFRKAWQYVKTEQAFIFNLLGQYPGGLKVRKLYQGTESYTRLLALSYHPRFLQDKASRALCLLTVLEMDEKYGVARQSYHALLKGDIPVHTATIYPPEKRQNKLADDLIRRLASLTEESLRFQSNIIRLSISSLTTISEAEKPLRAATFSVASGLNAIERVFATILNTRFRGKYFNYRPETHVFSEMQNSLYAGTAGLAFISLCLYIATNNKDYIDKAIYLTEGTFATNDPEFGAFIGDASYAFILDMLYTLTHERDYLDRAINIMHQNLACADSGEAMHEFLTGHAGCMVIALNLLRHDKYNPLLLSVIHAHLNAILDDCQHIDADKITWDEGLCGFSQGNAGIIYALGLYLEQCGIEHKERIRNVIRKAVNYENQFKSDNGWKDLRAENDEKNNSNFWCHGAPGIALARHKINALNLPAVQEDLTLALGLIDKHTRDINAFALCHGAPGNLLIKDYLTGGADREALVQLTDALLASLDSETGRQNIATLNADISLMTGICGVLYAWLYLHYPLPFILMLAPCPDLPACGSDSGQ